MTSGLWGQARGIQDFGSADELARQAAGESDVVIGTVGGAVLDASYDLLHKGGRLVTLSAPPDQDRAAQRDIRAVFFVVTADPAALGGLAEQVATGRLRPLISQVFPLAEGRQAYESGQHARPPGKTLLAVR